MVFYVIIGLTLLPSLGFAQTGPAEPAGEPAPVESAVAILPLGRDETPMAQQFYEGIIDAVAALEKYSPQPIQREAFTQAGVPVPMDMPPSQDLTAGARYALSGGVYMGSRTPEYYLQLWLWDMSGVTMIYSDILTYENTNDALLSLPGLVEWLFSHIREVAIAEEPEVLPEEPWFSLGLRTGFSRRWYQGDRGQDARAVCIEGGIFGSVDFNSLFTLQLELLFTGDTLVYRNHNSEHINVTIENEHFRAFSLMVPLVIKMNFRPGPVRLSPLAGIYVAAPLGEMRYHTNVDDENRYYSYSTVPVGYTAGVQGAVKFGPGTLFADLRYAGDFGAVTVNN
ncbi:MAG: outer membrane beta-barrel protein, partial [Treponema sp.]|nr:outer membrane beta-barrel protein [Treponema sp.]